MEDKKQEILNELLLLGYGIETAKKLYCKHEDMVEVNIDLLTPAELALQLEEQDLQGYDEED